MKILTSPSLLACDFLHLEDEVRRAERAGADWLHADVMDGSFVPNISFGFDIIRAVHSVTQLPLDVHMMTSAPQHYIQVLRDAGAYGVTVHNDLDLSEAELTHMLEEIRAEGMHPAIALRPKIPAESIRALIPYVDMILVMTVEPGFGGQKFMEDMLSKVAAVRRMATEAEREIHIQVDGGIHAQNAPQAAAAGANVFVVGTSSFRAPDMRQALETVKNVAAAAYEKEFGEADACIS